MADAKMLKVTMVGSVIGQTQRQRQTLRGLGLTRRGRSVTVRGDAPTLGMIRKISHLVRVES
ncbi:MAG: 50S ribosomal protein L30 [Candidatus Binatia bacterium]